MPVVEIQYDDSAISRQDAAVLSEAMHGIISKAVDIEDVPVYTNSAEIKFKVAPIEVFVRMSKGKIIDREALVNRIRNGISKWKKGSGFKHKINFTLIPMDWDINIEK
jgi:hypothetical protein